MTAEAVETAPARPAGGVGRQFAGGLALRVARYPLQAAFVFAVPPILGPEAYGAYATCLALFALVVEATDLGTMPLFGRLAPALGPARGAQLARQVLWSRLALAAGPGALLLAVLWTPRPEDPLLFALVLGAVLVVPFQQVLFARLYARGEIVRVMARDPLRSALSLALVVPGYLAGGLVGAIGALLVAQATLVALGAVWARPVPADFAPPRSLAGLGAAVRFGLAAALPTLLTTVSMKVGTPLLSRFGRPAAEVAAFDLATHGLALAVALAAYPYAALLPTLGPRVDAGRGDEAHALLGRVVVRSTAVALVVVAGLVAAGRPLLGLLLGPGFAAVYPNLLALVGGGIFAVLVSQAGVGLALLDRRPVLAVAPAGLLAAVTAAATLAAAGPIGAPGAIGALAAGLAAQALALLALAPGLASLVARPVGLGLAAAAPALALGGLDAFGHAALGVGPRVAAAALALGAAAWLVKRSRGDIA